MSEIDLLQMALGLTPPWYVRSSEFSVDDKRLDIYLDFHRGGRFSCPECGASDCPAYDTEERTWRHLNFFEHVSYLHARTPRVDLRKVRGQSRARTLGADGTAASRCCSRRSS